jgi:hypothetical protein
MVHVVSAPAASPFLLVLKPQTACEAVTCVILLQAHVLLLDIVCRPTAAAARGRDGSWHLQRVCCGGLACSAEFLLVLAASQEQPVCSIALVWSLV